MTKIYKQPEEIKIDDPIIERPIFMSELLGSIETVASVPAGKPTKFIDQFKFYSSGVTYRLYVYNAKDNVWRYTTLT